MATLRIMYYVYCIMCNTMFFVFVLQATFSCPANYCKNGGTLQENPVIRTCWCICPPDFQGDFDCGRPTFDIGEREMGGCRLANDCV